MPVMQKLAAMIEERLKERGFCILFEAELERCWPSEKFEDLVREKEIEAFAKSHGWTVFILALDSGIRAIFHKQTLGIDRAPTSDLKGNGALFD